ncbi:hypothetical protein Anapl_16349 [Anas platyrhynchos]|uniref:Uncharacterized protein n=1 Tax=Anas platyrhynchos TaxID=8839 RepID=R0JEC9_ANAPL|nr:hypothetical protein Anapl_16349 [Anas platyrhynchos]
MGRRSCGVAAGHDGCSGDADASLSFRRPKILREPIPGATRGACACLHHQMSVQRCPSDSSTTGQRSLSAEGIEDETRCSAPRHNNIPALQELAEKCAPMAAELSILIFLGRHGLVAVAPWQPAPCPLRLLPNGSKTPPGAACSWGMASYPPLPPHGPQYGQQPVPGRPVLAHGPACGQPMTGPASHPPALGPGALSSWARRQPLTPFPGGGISPQKRDPWRSVPGDQPGGAPVGAWLWSGAGGVPLVLSEGMSCKEGGGVSCCWSEDGGLEALRTVGEGCAAVETCVSPSWFAQALRHTACTARGQSIEGSVTPLPNAASPAPRSDAEGSSRASPCRNLENSKTVTLCSYG